MTFMLTPLYTNYMSASDIGDIATLYSAIALVNIVYSFGMEPAFMRFWSATDAGLTKRVYTVAYISVGLVAALTTVLTILFSDAVASSDFVGMSVNGAYLVSIAAFIPLLDALVLIPFAHLRMMRKAKRFALLRLLTIVVNVVLNLVFVVQMHMGIKGVLWAGVASSAVTMFFFLPDLFQWLQRRFDTQLFREMMGFGLPTIPSSLSARIVEVADRPIMRLLTTSSVVGLYQTNFRLAIPMMMFVQVFEYAWRPFYLQHRDAPDAKSTFSRVLTLFTVACGFVFLITALFMPYIVRLPFIGGRFINPDYWSGLSIVPIVLLAYYFNGLVTNIAAGYHIAKSTMRLPIATGIAALVNVVATFALVPSLGITGAAWAKVAAYGASVVVLLWMLPKVYPMSYDWRRIITIVLCVAAVYGAVQFLPTDDSTQITARILAIPVLLLLLLATRSIGVSTLMILKGLLRR